MKPYPRMHMFLVRERFCVEFLEIVLHVKILQIEIS